jgi:hypothetical protein
MPRGTAGLPPQQVLSDSQQHFTSNKNVRQLLAKHTPALLGMQSTVWGNSHMLPSRGLRFWVVYLTPKIETLNSLLSASLVGEARCRCRKVWLTRIDYYYIEQEQQFM